MVLFVWVFFCVVVFFVFFFQTWYNNRQQGTKQFDTSLMTLTFLEGHVLRVSQKFCSDFFEKYLVNLDEILFALETLQCV